jgi:molybdopterin-guanine dinucleotide biosynthesis adapter protein
MDLKVGEDLMEKPPVVTIVGKSNAGKTTFLEKLIRELKSRNIRVGTIKHGSHDFDIDVPGKDTWRHARAGADAVIITSSAKFALVKKVEEEMSLDRVAELIPDMDIILTEGFKRSDKPKIEISRTAHSSELLCTSDELIALVSDAQWDIGVPVFGLDDASGVADLLQKKYGLPPR